MSGHELPCCGGFMMQHEPSCDRLKHNDQESTAKDIERATTRVFGEGLTYNEIKEACKNIGYDIGCGACAELFFTGSCGHECDPECTSITSINPRRPLIVKVGQ